MGYAEASLRRIVVNRFLIAAILCAASSWTSLAQTAADAPATKDDVERYLEAVHSHDMMLKMMEAMSKPMHQTAHEQCQRDKDNLPADCEARINKMMDDMIKGMPLDEMMQAMVPAFQKHFTKGDMDALIAFYSGPTGQKVLQELPEVMTEGMEAMMPIARKSVDSMTVRIQQQVAEMMKESEKKTGGDAPTQVQN
jgi:uncharacterized protein